MQAIVNSINNTALTAQLPSVSREAQALYRHMALTYALRPHRPSFRDTARPVVRHHREPVLVVPYMVRVDLAEFKVTEESGGALADLDEGNLPARA